MELVSPQTVQASVIARPFLLRAVIVAVVLGAAVIAGALAWTSAQATPAVQSGNYLLDPALIQVRQGERPSGVIGNTSGTHLLDPALIDLRRGEKARLDRAHSAGSRLPDRAPVHVGNGPLAGGQ
jgi:hypothetical protein